MSGRIKTYMEVTNIMTAFLTGSANRFDTELAKILSDNGYEVYIGIDSVENISHIDLYIDTNNYKSSKDTFTVSDDIDYDVMQEIYTENVLKPIENYEKLLPLTQNGQLKRYCFITSSKASVNLSRDVSEYGYNMSKAGLHNFLQITKNRLSPEGFTFRAFDPLTGELSDKEAAMSAFNYFTRRRGVEGGRDDERTLVIRDAFGRQYSW
jgi:hypothetical protein